VTTSGDMYRRYLDVWSAVASGATTHAEANADEREIAVTALAAEDCRSGTLRTCSAVNSLLARPPTRPVCPD
jgi:hypothetical protein